MATKPTLRTLRHVALCTTAFEESVDYYGGPFGLEPVLVGSDVAYLRGSGSEHHVLELHRAASNGLHHLTLGVATVEDVDDFHAWACTEGAEIVTEPRRFDTPDGGYGFELLDPERRVLRITAESHAVPPRSLGLPVPRKVAHIVLNTTDIDRDTAFLTRVLGLRISDWSEHQMVFLRANSDHHVIALNQAAHAAPNHVAYEVGSLDHWLRSIGRLKQAGHEAAWGPGRHGPGDNAFAYYVDPAGMVPEVNAEVLQIDEATWMPRVWRRTPELSDLFHTAGPPSPHVRAHMAGTPDAGHPVETVA